MTFFGLTDPYIIAGYISCILCVILCCGWALFKKEPVSEEKEEKEEEGEDSGV